MLLFTSKFINNIFSKSYRINNPRYLSKNNKKIKDIDPSNFPMLTMPFDDIYSSCHLDLLLYISNNKNNDIKKMISKKCIICNGNKKNCISIINKE